MMPLPVMHDDSIGHDAVIVLDDVIAHDATNVLGICAKNVT
jgi:hypothetical protein